MRRELPGSRFASLVLAEVSAAGRMEVVNAGHCPPLLRRADGEILALPPNGRSSVRCRSRAGRRSPLGCAPDDTLLLVSDGVLEAHSPDDEEFGTERLWSALARDGALSPRDLVLRLLDEVARFRAQAPPTDDTTIVAIRA